MTDSNNSGSMLLPAFSCSAMLLQTRGKEQCDTMVKWKQRSRYQSDTTHHFTDTCIIKQLGGNNVAIATIRLETGSTKTELKQYRLLGWNLYHPAGCSGLIALSLCLSTQSVDIFFSCIR